MFQSSAWIVQFSAFLEFPATIIRVRLTVVAWKDPPCLKECENNDNKKLYTNLYTFVDNLVKLSSVYKR